MPKKQQSEQGAWDLSRVRPKEDVKQEAERLGKVVHFGALLTLCHQKHAELAEALRSYKGRIVFRGDCVKTHKDEYAVFSEQGTSANQTASTKVVDAVAHLPGCIGEESDAMSAYTQMRIADAARLLGKDVFPETWVSLPPNRRPAEWAEKGIVEPVVPLTLNLYGHPLAGLLWDKGSREKILQAGFAPIGRWECLYG